MCHVRPRSLETCKVESFPFWNAAYSVAESAGSTPSAVTDPSGESECSSRQVRPASLLRQSAARANGRSLDSSGGGPKVLAYMTFASTGSKRKKRAAFPRLNIRHDLPPSCERKQPVMSPDTRTAFVLWGLMVGRNWPPPPPGPSTSHRSRRGAPEKTVVASSAVHK